MAMIAETKIKEFVRRCSSKSEWKPDF